MKKANRPSGFTLLELIVVVAIVAILAAALTPIILNQVERARVASTVNGLNQIALGMQRFRVDTGRWPFNNILWAPGTESGEAQAFGNLSTALITNPSPGVTPTCTSTSTTACWGGPYVSASKDLSGQKDYLGNVLKAAYAAAGQVGGASVAAGAGFGDNAASEGFSAASGTGAMVGGTNATGGIYLAPCRSGGCPNFIPSSVVAAVVVSNTVN